MGVNYEATGSEVIGANGKQRVVPTTPSLSPAPKTYPLLFSAALYFQGEILHTGVNPDPLPLVLDFFSFDFAN